MGMIRITECLFTCSTVEFVLHSQLTIPDYQGKGKNTIKIFLPATRFLSKGMRGVMSHILLGD